MTSMPSSHAAVLLLALLLPAAQAAPYTPAADAELVQRLPERWDAAARRQRAALARDPQQLPLALATAQAAITRARRAGDPRELGLAQAALAPWWSLATPPPAVLLLRATVRQSQHQFDTALADLDQLLARPDTPLPVLAQAGLTRVTVLQVTGRLAAAAQACEALRAARFQALGASLAIPARACAAELRSLRGEPAHAATELTALALQAPGDRWLALLRAELAERLGDHAAAERLFREATGADPDVYTVAARADWLLERGRNREALTLLPARDDDADALRLRRTIALHRLHDPQAARLAADLLARFAAARQRGETGHAREEARLALDVLAQPGRALALARENWAQQQEPADAVLLLRAALAAGRPADALPLRDWARDPAAVDRRLAADWHRVRT